MYCGILDMIQGSDSFDDYFDQSKYFLLIIINNYFYCRKMEAKV